MTSTIKNDAKARMDKTIDALRNEFTKLRTGKASPALLDGIQVDYYGSSMPIKQVANVSAPEPRLLVIQPWEKNMLQEIEKAIQKSDLGFNPVNDGIVIRIPVPQLTEERRKDLVKLAKKNAEDSKVSVRNIRRDANEQVKKAEKNKDISEDEMHIALDEIQKVTDEFIKKIDEVTSAKEKEILEI